MQRPDDFDPALSWTASVDLVESDQRLECGISVEQDVVHQRLAPPALQPPLIGLLRDLAGLGATAGSQRVTQEAQALIGTDSIDRFIGDVLLDPDRELPVLLFTSVKEHDGTFPGDAADPSLVGRELCGLAHVYLLPRTEDTHKLTRRLGMLSAYDGAIRLYWPQMRLDDPPPRHPLHLRQRLNRSSVPAIIRRIVEAGARAYRPPEGTEAMLAMHRRAHEEERIARRLEHEPVELHATVLRQELVTAMDAAVLLEQELEAVRDELQRVRRRLDEAAPTASDADEVVLEGSADQLPATKPRTTSASSSPRSS